MSRTANLGIKFRKPAKNAQKKLPKRMFKCLINNELSFGKLPMILRRDKMLSINMLAYGLQFAS